MIRLSFIEFSYHAPPCCMKILIVNGKMPPFLINLCPQNLSLTRPEEKGSLAIFFPPAHSRRKAGSASSVSESGTCAYSQKTGPAAAAAHISLPISEIAVPPLPDVQVYFDFALRRITIYQIRATKNTAKPIISAIMFAK